MRKETPLQGRGLHEATYKGSADYTKFVCVCVGGGEITTYSSAVPPITYPGIATGIGDDMKVTFATNLLLTKAVFQWTLL